MEEKAKLEAEKKNNSGLIIIILILVLLCGGAGTFVFINKDNENEEVLNIICDTLNLKNVQHLKRMNACNIYLVN